MVVGREEKAVLLHNEWGPLLHEASAMMDVGIVMMGRCRRA